jgi:putative restriction endonuclease
LHSSCSLATGDVYTRQQLRELFGIKAASLNNGIFRPSGHDSVWLFATKSKTPDRTQYTDFLAGDEFHFDGQMAGLTDRLIIEHIDRGLELLVFYRESRLEFDNGGFRFIGVFDYQSSFGSAPTRFLLTRSKSEKQK